MPFKSLLALIGFTLTVGCAKTIQDNGAKVGRAQTNTGANSKTTPVTSSTANTNGTAGPEQQPFGNLLSLEVPFTSNKLIAVYSKSASVDQTLKIEKFECPAQGCQPSAVLVEVKSADDTRYCTGFHSGKNQVQFTLDCLKDKKLTDALCTQQITLHFTDGKSASVQTAACKKMVGVVQSASTSSKYKDGLKESYALIEADKNLPGVLTAKRSEWGNLQLKNVVGFNVDLTTKKVNQFAQDCSITYGTEYLPKSYSGISLNAILAGEKCNLAQGSLGSLILSDDQKSVEGQIAASAEVNEKIFQEALATLKLDYKIANKLYTPFLAQSFRCSKLTLSEERPATCDRTEEEAKNLATLNNSTKFKNGFRNETLFQMARDWFANYPNNSFLYTFEFAIVENKTWTFMPKPKCAIPGVFKANESVSASTIPYADVVNGINSYGFAGWMADTSKLLKVEMQFNRDQIGGGLNSVFVLKNLDTTAPIATKLEGYFNQARADVNFCDENDDNLVNEFSMSTKSMSSN